MDDGVLSVLDDQEQAGIDIVTDGEVRRESYSAPLANAPEGVNREKHEVLVGRAGKDRKSTRLNSSHVRISYAVFCLKKKNEIYFSSFCVWALNALQNSMMLRPR